MPSLRRNLLSLIFSAVIPALSAQDTIKIGEYASLTGKEASFGITSHQGVTLAIEEANVAG
ncbi:MAG TPA: ethanolamine utilization protein EutJ, partial [Opitutaceae bacterium]|nr:ethanolamine utilization protein EutJ [Opitutaceae bacterium]